MFGMEIAEKKFKNYFSVNYMYMYCVQVITSKTMKDVHIFKKIPEKNTLQDAITSFNVIH